MVPKKKATASQARSYIIWCGLISVSTLVLALPALMEAVRGFPQPRTPEEAFLRPEVARLMDGGVPSEIIQEFAECAEYGGTFSRSRIKPLIPDSCSVYPLVEPGGWEGRIEMGEITSIHGKWVGENPRVTLENQGGESIEGTSRTGMWGESLGDPLVGERIKTRPVWIRAQLPSPGPETLHTLLAARIDLEMIPGVRVPRL